MASTTFNDGKPWQGRTLHHDEFAAELIARRVALAGREAPRNAGDRRTASKRALLAAIEATGARW